MAERGGVAVALLAAGAARRFGGGKLDSPCAGRPVGARAAAALAEVGGAARLVVVPPAAPAFVDALKGWHRATNPDPDAGLQGSIAVAARFASDHGFDRLVIALADMPLVPAAHFARLVEAEGIAFTRYPDESRGVPAAFPLRCFAALVALPEGGAANHAWGEAITLLDPPHADALCDVDTPEDLAAVEALLRAR